MNREATYIFEDGKVYTMIDGKVVSAVKESDFGQGPLHHPGGPGDVAQDYGVDFGDLNQSCPDCGAQAGPDDQWCPECGSELGHMIHDHTDMPAPPADVQRDLARGASVVTPNGLKGQVLGKVAGIWGDEVTVRLENGRIVRLPVTPGLTAEASVDPVEENKVAALDLRLASSRDVTGTRASLVARLKELRTIQREARALVAESSHDDAQELDRIIVSAEYELGEVQEAIAHLADTEAFEPPAPFRMEAVEQATMGGSESTWLDHTMNEMVAEAEATDYEQLMDEGPEAFVAGLETAPLAHAATTRSIASEFIRSHTAAADPGIRDKYESVWLARVEQCRKAELSSRKETVHKEAAKETTEQSNLPDDVLFI